MTRKTNTFLAHKNAELENLHFIDVGIYLLALTKTTTIMIYLDFVGINQSILNKLPWQPQVSSTLFTVSKLYSLFIDGC